jgi:hypothetical protein
MSGYAEAASLTAALLVRKGNAAPITFVPRPAPVRLVEPSASAQPVAASRPRPSRKGAPRVSLRLDEPRMKQLRLVAAQLATTRQATLLRALDEFVERHLAGSGSFCLCIKSDGVVTCVTENGCAAPAGEGSDVRA